MCGIRKPKEDLDADYLTSAGHEEVPQQLSKPPKPPMLRHRRPLPPHGPPTDTGMLAAPFELNKDTANEALMSRVTYLRTEN